jgi:hypothetical protein
LSTFIVPWSLDADAAGVAEHKQENEKKALS